MTDTGIPALPPTIAQLAFFASGRYPKPDLMGQCRASGLTYISGRDLLERVRDLSLGLRTLGMTRGARVALMSENRPEWVLADLAVQTAGAVTVPIYPTASPDQLAFILRDSGAAIVIVSGLPLFERLADVARSASSLKAVVLIDPDAGAVLHEGVDVLSFDEVAARGHRRILDAWGVGRVFHDEAKQVGPDDLATIIYTSGTTGEPKGVMLTHGNLVANIAGVLSVVGLSERDVGLSFLPLCHALERMVAFCYLASGVSLIFAESFGTLGRDLAAVRPTILSGVPRLFDKLHARILAKGEAERGVKRRIFQWSVTVANRRGEVLECRAPVSPWLRWQSALAERLVLRKIREGLGGRLRLTVSGGAPLRPEIGRFFLGVGVPILEGYGLTETAPVLTVVPLEAIRFGTVGRAIPGVELRLGADGEILARGPNVMRGYHGLDEETAQVLRDGWFHTGDIGTIDADGYVRITDRKKELIVTSGGRNVAPQPIEAAVRADPLVAEAVLIGDRRPYLSMLIVPDAASLGRSIDDPAVRVSYQQIVDRVNAGLAPHERIKRFALLPREFSIESGELTPTLKVRRRIVEEKYAGVIAGLYE